MSSPRSRPRIWRCQRLMALAESALRPEAPWTLRKYGTLAATKTASRAAYSQRSRVSPGRGVATAFMVRPPCGEPGRPARLAATLYQRPAPGHQASRHGRRQAPGSLAIPGLGAEIDPESRRRLTTGPRRAPVAPAGAARTSRPRAGGAPGAIAMKRRDLLKWT